MPDRIKSTADIRRAFRVYDEIRRPRSQELVTRSRQNGMLLELQRHGGGKATKGELRIGLEKNMKWVWEVDLEEMLEKAMRLFDVYKNTDDGNHCRKH